MSRNVLKRSYAAHSFIFTALLFASPTFDDRATLRANRVHQERQASAATPRRQQQQEQQQSPRGADVEGRGVRLFDRAGARARNRSARTLRALNLAPEQRAQIRFIREQSEPKRRAATQRLRAAQRALDLAIYSDTADESVIELRVREVAAAQAETVRLRAMTELKLRRVLTSQQLAALRDLRQQAQERRIAERRRALNSNANQPRINPSPAQ